MKGIMEAFLNDPAFQSSVVAVVTWAIIKGAKKLGWLPARGAKIKKRISAAVTATLVALCAAWLAHVGSGAPVDFGALVPAIVIAWVSATGLHTLTKRS